MKLSKQDLLNSSNKTIHRMFEQLSEDGSTESAINEAERTIYFTAISNTNDGIRQTMSGLQYIERLDVNSVDVSNFKTFLCNHKVSVESAVGRIVETFVENGALKVKVKFGTSPDADAIFRKYVENIITSVSVGYRYDLNNAEIIDTEGSEMPLVILRGIQLFELSSVVFPFDEMATIGRSVDNTLLPIGDNPMQEEGPIRLLSDSAKIRIRILALRTQI